MGKATDPFSSESYFRRAWRYADPTSTTGFRKDLAAIDPTRTPDMPDVPAPPQPPSLTDEAVQRARMMELARGRAGGRRSTFLTGPLGAAGSAPAKPPALTGR